MDEQQRDRLLEKIEAEIAATEKDIASLEEKTKPIAPDDSIGRLSRMDAIQNKSVNEAALRAAKIRLTQLRHALANIDDPEFGICDMCMEPIPIGRIMLMPETRRCVECADK